ncbi:MAG: AEC family transporter [Rhodospirillaceae bacterium]|nr:AEC family transporter [Rhodospirillaceae bacterium]
MTAQIFAIIAPVFLIAAIGFAWARAKMPFDHNMVSALVLNVGAPCLLLSQLLTHPIRLDLMAEIIAAGVGVMSLSALGGILLVRALRLPVRAYLPVLIFPNVGNMGLPLCFFAFGDVGLALAVAYFAVVSLFQFSLGIGIASGRFGINLLLRNPVMWSLPLAMILLGTDTAVPAWIMNTLTIGGSFAIPLMLMSLGTSLATLSVRSLGRAMGFSVARIFGGFAVALAVTAALGLEGSARGAVLIQSSMPAAVFNYLFAVRYGNAASDVAGIVLTSTVLSFLTLPLLLAYVLGG